MRTSLNEVDSAKKAQGFDNDVFWNRCMGDCSWIDSNQAANIFHRDLRRDKHLCWWFFGIPTLNTRTKTRETI